MLLIIILSSFGKVVFYIKKKNTSDIKKKRETIDDHVRIKIQWGRVKFKGQIYGSMTVIRASGHKASIPK